MLIALSILLVSFDLGSVTAQDATPIPNSSDTPSTTSGYVPAGDDVSAAEQQLADKYAPIAMLKSQASQCDKDGEGYFPVTVDFLFDNPDIALKAKGDGSATDDVVIKQGITPQDLVTAGENTYLDFPGNPRDPKCVYEQYFREKVQELGLEPATYVAFRRDEANGLLYVEYWFYYYFNDWNDTHESDWEMIQLTFNTTSVEEALTRDPVRVGYAQHGGGELADWGDDKLQMDGSNLIVYPSAGSHATYYDAHTFIGWGENGTAFGCDVTTAPHTATPLKAVVIPDVIDPDGPFAWALYEGRWGQRDQAVFNGPYGLNHGSKWHDPTQSFSTWRYSTLKVPDSKASGLNATDLFCGLSKWGSKAIIFLGSHPWATAALLLFILLLVGASIYRVWGFFLEALDIYGNELRTFLGIGMLAVPIGIVFNGFVYLLRQAKPIEWMLDLFDHSAGGNLTLAAIVGGAQQAAMTLIIVPAVLYAMKDIRQGIKPGVWRSLRQGLRSFPALLLALVIYVAVLGVATLSIFLIPVAIYVAVRWLFYPQAIVLEELKPGWRGLRGSWNVTRRQWIRTLGATIGFLILALVPGPLVGVIILIFGGSRVQFANIVSSFLYSLLLPLAYIGLTMVYRRLKGEQIVEPTMMTRELHPERARKLPGAAIDGVLEN
ncbi:MAG TPA: hypothetical protein VFP05_11435 [Thermomicrobiales bacterium]|nr:hypothetical protein [Thermomicrobiales bacterium]